MAANQARKSAPTRLKMRSRAGMICTAEPQDTGHSDQHARLNTQQDLALDTGAAMMPSYIGNTDKPCGHALLRHGSRLPFASVYTHCKNKTSPQVFWLLLIHQGKQLQALLVL